MRLFPLIFLLSACSAPCPFVCQDDGGCPPGWYCLNQSACLPDCQRCGGGCVETVQNCGACGNACAVGKKCSAGTCQDACAAGLSDCAGSCYDLNKDRVHCGACGTTCNRDETCASGVCTKVDVCQ